MSQVPSQDVLITLRQILDQRFRDLSASIEGLEPVLELLQSAWTETEDGSRQWL